MNEEFEKEKIFKTLFFSLFGERRKGKRTFRTLCRTSFPSIFRKKRKKSIDFCDGDVFFPLSFQRKTHFEKRKKRKEEG